jgi:hypothetical protein
VVIWTWAYWILDFVQLLLFLKITLVSETLSLNFFIKTWDEIGVWYKVTLLFTEHGPTFYLTTETNRFYENLSCLPNCNVDGKCERKSGPKQNETFSKGKLLIANLLLCEQHTSLETVTNVCLKFGQIIRKFGEGKLKDH